jgi:hypothetical protein
MSHEYCNHSNNIRKYLDVTDMVVTDPTYVNIRCHGYCSHMSNMHKYLDFTELYSHVQHT